MRIGFYVCSGGKHTFVYGPDGPSAVIHLYRMGLSRKAIARLTGISIRTVSKWCRNGPPAGVCADAGYRHRPGPRRRQVNAVDREALLAAADLASYAYLLGLYLGDGHIAQQRRDVYGLRISMDSRYPRIIGETVRAMRAVLPRNPTSVYKHPRHNVVQIVCYSKGWAVLFPQHGPGRKHSRRSSSSNGSKSSPSFMRKSSCEDSSTQMAAASSPASPVTAGCIATRATASRTDRATSWGSFASTLTCSASPGR
jgi:hypothetical protein